jgi:hypothetical protein
MAYYAPISSTGVGTWSSTASYPVSIVDAGCSIYNSYIYCVGSYSSSSYYQLVYYAPISNTGIGTWTSTAAYPVAMYDAGCSIYNGYIYCVGTNSGPPLAYYAPISITGVGTWTSTASYPLSMANAGCSILGGYIYCVGTSAVNPYNYVYYAPISNTGIGTWTSTAAAYPVAMDYAGCSIYGSYIYCVGTAGTAAQKEVYYAPISSTGVGSWVYNTANPYPVAMSYAGCIISNGYIYCVGTSSTSPYNYVYYAPISSTGVGTWSSTASYPVLIADAYCEIPGYGGGYLSGGGPLSLYTPFISASNALVDIGQYETLSVSWPGGTPPFTVKFYNESNSLTFNTLGGLLLSNSPATNTFKLVTAGGGITWNGVVVDSSPATKNSIDLHIGVNSAITGTPATPTPTSPTIDNGQSITLTAGTGTVSGGTTPYTYNWFTGIACQTLTAGTGSQITVSPTVTTGYSVQVMDSASTPANSVCSGVDTVTVSSALPYPSLTGNALLDSGQKQILSASWGAGGTGAIKVQFYNESKSATFNSVPGATSPTTNTVVILATSQTNNVWNVLITDSAYTPLTHNSVDFVFGTNAALTGTPTISPSSPTIDTGRSVTLTESGVSGGTTPYVYNWFTGPNCGTANIISGQVASSISVSPTTTNSYSVNVIDSASIPTNSICSTVADTVNVNPALTITAWTGTASLISSQVQTLSGSWTGGTSPFTANFYNETGSVVFNTIPSASSPATNSFTTCALTTQSFTWNFIVTDSSYLSAVTKNSIDLSFTVINSVCMPSLSTTAIMFPSKGAGSYAPTSNGVNVMNVGNIGAMIYVGGSNWVYLSNSFLVGNTLWSSTSGDNIGTQLTGSAIGVNTLIPVKNLGVAGGNDIYFGVNVPKGQPPGAYTQTVNVMLSC